MIYIASINGLRKDQTSSFLWQKSLETETPRDNGLKGTVKTGGRGEGLAPGTFYLIGFSEPAAMGLMPVGICGANGATWDGDGMQNSLSHLSPCVGVWVALLKIG